MFSKRLVTLVLLGFIIALAAGCALHTSVDDVIEGADGQQVMLENATISEDYPVDYLEVSRQYQFVAVDEVGDEIIVQVRSNRIDFEPEPGSEIRISGNVILGPLDVYDTEWEAGITADNVSQR